MNRHTHLTARSCAAILIASLALAGAGCSSIVHGGNRDITVGSVPSAAKVSVYRVTKDKEPELLQTATTPCRLSLDPKGGFFKGQPYRLHFELDGHAASDIELTPKLSGWYFGNIVFGGLIGLLIVDPITGSMWNLSPDKIDASLASAQPATAGDAPALLIKLLAQTTPAERAAMVRVN